MSKFKALYTIWIGKYDFQWFNLHPSNQRTMRDNPSVWQLVIHGRFNQIYFYCTNNIT